MPRGFSFPQKQDVWIPMVQTSELLANRQDRGQWFAFGRLADGVTVRMARAEMETIGRRLGAAYPRTNQGRNLLPQVQTFNEFFIFDNETAIYWSLWGAVAFVLSIACANLANLTFARAMERSRQISVRIALGAVRWRILRQLLAESLIVTGAGSLLGLFIAQWGLRAYAAADRVPADRPGGSSITRWITASSLTSSRSPPVRRSSWLSRPCAACRRLISAPH
jgi:hypothetical protein